MTDLIALDKFFESRSFISGERMTVADLAFVSSLKANYESKALDIKVSEKFINLTRYYNTIIKQDAFKKADKLKLYTAVKEPAKAQENKPQAKSQGKSQGKPTPSKAEDKQLTGEDLLDQLEKAESKSKDPFSELPAGNFNFDDFKRKYSNFPPAESIPYFWEKFDPENYSIWLCDYKYNDELGLIFMSSNLIKGMFQRLDKMRKQSFGSHCLFGEDHKSAIAGIWVWRGQDLAFKLSPDWQVDYESYDWKKLDPKADETKKLVELFFTQDDNAEYKGHKLNDGRIFK